MNNVTSDFNHVASVYINGLDFYTVDVSQSIIYKTTVISRKYFVPQISKVSLITLINLNINITSSFVSSYLSISCISFIFSFNQSTEKKIRKSFHSITSLYKCLLLMKSCIFLAILRCLLSILTSKSGRL